MRGPGRMGSAKEKVPEVTGWLETKVERKEFLRRTALLAVSALAAGSLGALAGCAGKTAAGSGTTHSGGGTQSTAPAPAATETAPGPSAVQDQAPSGDQPPAAAPECRFYDDGTCRRTGETCTNCIAR